MIFANCCRGNYLRNKKPPDRRRPVTLKDLFFRVTPTMLTSSVVTTTPPSWHIAMPSGGGNGFSTPSISRRNTLVRSSVTGAPVVCSTPAEISAAIYVATWAGHVTQTSRICRARKNPRVLARARSTSAPSSSGSPAGDPAPDRRCAPCGPSDMTGCRLHLTLRCRSQPAALLIRIGGFRPAGIRACRIDRTIDKQHQPPGLAHLLDVPARHASAGGGFAFAQFLHG